jgi:hypothetical protein
LPENANDGKNKKPPFLNKNDGFVKPQIIIVKFLIIRKKERILPFALSGI